MSLLLLGLLSLNVKAHDPPPTPTAEPVVNYWTRVTCVEDEGIVDCAADKGPGVEPGQPVDSIECDDSGKKCQCADYWGRYPDPQDQDWIMATASIFAIFMAFGIGANDAANSWASSVGAKAITVGYAVMLCGFFEWAGATSIGYGVSKTIQKGVSKLTASDCWACGKCDSSVTLTMGGSMGALVGASMFLLLASGTAVPVSTTHSIVGGVVGMTLAGAGGHCLNWELDGGLLGIVMSWIISPVLSGVVAAVGYTLSLQFIIKTNNARWRALMLLPLLYGFITFGSFMMIFLKAKAIKKKMDQNSKFIASALIGIAVTALVAIFLKPVVVKGLPSEDGTTDLYLKRKSKIERTDEEDPKAGMSPSSTIRAGGKGKVVELTDHKTQKNEDLGDTEKDSTDAGQDRALKSPRIKPSASPTSPSMKIWKVEEGKMDTIRTLSMGDIVLSTDPDSTPLRDWTVETTLRWVTDYDGGRFAHLAATWGKMKVDGEVLWIVTEPELKDDLEVTCIGDRKALMRALEDLKTKDLEQRCKFEVALLSQDMGRQIVDADNADQLDAVFVFRYLLVFTACLESFAHGSNDTANATGPFSAVYQLYTNGGKDCSSDEGTVWIMCVAGIFVAIGVCTFGYRVIKTIGENLTIIDFHKGFYIEVGSTLATMIATVLEFPVSTTHCQVGGVIGVGLVSRFNGTGSVSWGLFGKIFLTWVLTLPIAGSIAAIVVTIAKGALIIPNPPS